MLQCLDVRMEEMNAGGISCRGGCLEGEVRKGLSRMLTVMEEELHGESVT